RLDSIEILGTQMISSTVLKDLMTVKPGQLLNANDLDKDLRKIEEYYKNQGLVLAYVDDVNISPEGALTITINEGFLKDIKIMGNDKTRDYVIRRELDIKPGEVFNLNQVQLDLRNIYNLGLFEDVKPRIEQAQEGSNEVNLVIEVDEKKTGNLNTGAGYSSKDGWFGYVEVAEQNLFGRAQRVGFKWEFGQVSNYELSFYDPWAFGKEFSFGIDLYNTTSKNVKDAVKDSKYTKNSKGGSIQIGKPLAEDITGLLKFKYENTFTNWDDPNIEDEKGDTRSLTLTTVRDTTDNPFAPTTGSKDIASIEYAGQILGGDYDFTKYRLEMRRYFPGFKDDHTWAFRLKGGLGTGDLPFHEEFKIGGGETLRGYDSNSLSGDRMLLANAEYRFPIVKSLQGAVFVDAGNSWVKDAELKFEDLKFSVGAGVRMNTPIGQIRLDYAFGEDGGMPHFSIGQTF
ncbi:MAG: BamA/TamA family outer membrane protein, partial [Desulfovibrionales bacterium]|nr:BamA/TamA family outer membrane protein [Desulfovibrionales bacterium]